MIDQKNGATIISPISTGKLNEALAKAQSEFDNLTKDGKADYATKKGGQISYGYATLQRAVRACHKNKQRTL